MKHSNIKTIGLVQVSFKELYSLESKLLESLERCNGLSDRTETLRKQKIELENKSLRLKNTIDEYIKLIEEKQKIIDDLQLDSKTRLNNVVNYFNAIKANEALQLEVQKMAFAEDENNDPYLPIELK